jgi:hypothetical protein
MMLNSSGGFGALAVSVAMSAAVQLTKCPSAASRLHQCLVVWGQQQQHPEYMC